MKAQTYVDDLFENLEREEENEMDKTFESKESSLENLSRAFEQVMTSNGGTNSLPDYAYRKDRDDFYKICELNIPSIYTSKDINRLIQWVAVQVPNLDKEKPRNLENKLGMFVSALINHSAERDFLIDIPFMYELGALRRNYFNHLGFVGYRNNGKNIRIQGTGGPGCGIGLLMDEGKIQIKTEGKHIKSSNFGDSMKGGEIHLKTNYSNYSNVCFVEVGANMIGGVINVEGDISRVGQDMLSGTIRVQGDVLRAVGSFMKGGKIDITGNCTKEQYGGNCQVGYMMAGGRIEIQGGIRSMPGKKMSGGEIYVHGGKAFRLPRSAKGGNIHYKGRLIYPKTGGI